MLPLRRAYLYRELGYVRAAQGNFAASNPPFGAALSYYLREDLSKSEAKIILTVTDANGKTVRTLNGPMTAGVHRVYWDLRDEAHAAPRGGGGRGGFGAGEQETRDEEEEEEEAEAQSDPKSELQREAEQEGALQTPRRGAGRGGARHRTKWFRLANTEWDSRSKWAAQRPCSGSCNHSTSFRCQCPFHRSRTHHFQFRCRIDDDRHSRRGSVCHYYFPSDAIPRIRSTHRSDQRTV